MEVAGSDQMKACSLTAVEAMEKLSLKKRIHAALLENDFNPTLIHVEVPEKGIVKITGITQSDDEKEKIPRIAKAVPGVSKVQDDIRVVKYQY